MARSGQRRSGRIYPHERDTNDGVPVLGGDVEILEEHSVAVRETEQNDLSTRNKRNYRNRLQHLYMFWQEKYPQYYAVGVRELTEEELGDEDMFWWKNKHDVIYTGLNVQFVKAFLAHKKKKENGKTCSHVQLRKFHDAILFGAKKANERLPKTYYEEIEKYLDAFKKETVEARKDGMLDEQEADPITWVLFRNMLQWSLHEKNIFLWVFSLLQWHCMARSISIGGLALHCFRVGEDSLIARYDKSKADQTGEKVHDKHLYDNPFDPLVSLFLSMGVWFSLESSRFETTELLFQDETKEADAASQRYCTQLSELFTQYADQLKQFIRVDHANTHGIRKGSATKVSSGTTCPPPVSSIATRGEWSLGRVLDLYWHFAEPGDTFLGRVLAGFDPNGEEFATLPPHWILEDPMSNEKVKEAMHLMFATILQRWGRTAVDPTGILLYCLASVVWHVDFLKDTAARHPGHPFSMIPLLSNPTLLNDLKELVTLEPKGQVLTPTGIPPHVQHASVAKKILSLCVETLKTVQQMAENVKESVKEAFEEKAEENGQITGERLKTMLEIHQNSMVAMIDEKLTELKNEIRDAFPLAMVQQQEGGSIDNDNELFADGEEEEVLVEQPAQQGQTRVTYRTYCHGGRHWHVPKDFAFPTGVRLDTGWKMWLSGLPGYETVDSHGNRLHAPIRPIRKLKLDMLPRELKKNFQLHWRPIFSMMEQAPGIEVRETGIDAQYIQASFATGKEYLTTRVSYVFENERQQQDGWEISTWSKKVARSSIMKNGTDQDKANLPTDESFRNRPRQQRGRNKPTSDRRRVRRRVNNGNGAIVHDEFAQAFPNPEITPYMQRREQEIQEQMNQENEERRADMEEERRRHGDAVATDGSRLYVSVQQPGETQRNFGDVSEQGRKQYGQSIALTQQQTKVQAARVAGHCSIVGCSNPMLHATDQ